MAALRYVTYENKRQFVYVCDANATAKRDVASGFDTVDSCSKLVAKRAVRKRGFWATACDGEPRLKRRQQCYYAATPWSLRRFVQDRSELVLGGDEVWCHYKVVAVRPDPVLDVHYIALATTCPQRDEVCILANTHALFRKVKPIFSGRDQARLSALLVRLSDKRCRVRRTVASLIVGYFRRIMSKSDLGSRELSSAVPCLSAPRVESPEQVPGDSNSSAHGAVDKVPGQGGDLADMVTPTKRRYETHSTNSAEKCGPRPKISKLSLSYAQRGHMPAGAQNGTPPVPASVPSDKSAKETAVSEELSPLSVHACGSVSESTPTSETTPEVNSAAPDGTGRVHSPHDLGESTTAGCVASVQKQATRVASHLPAAFANWSPTTALSSKLSNRASGRSLASTGSAASGNPVNGGKAVSSNVPMLSQTLSSTGCAPRNERPVLAKENAKSPISIPSISSTSAPCEVPVSGGTVGLPGSGDAVPSNAAAEGNAALVWCKCGFGPVSRVAFESHSVTAHVMPFCHGCNLCGEKFAARKDLKCHFTVHSEVREPLAKDDPSAGNSVPGASLSSSANRVAEATANTDPCDASKGKLHWLLRPDLDGSPAMIHFFKCVIGQCRFTTDLPTKFSSHLSSHKLTEMGDLLCIYCGQTFDAIATLVQHMERFHRNLTFQCSHCLYRSALPIHNYLHHGWWHRNQKLVFYTCKNPGLHAGGAGLPTQHVSLTHYWCSITNCDFKSYNPDVFEWHLSAAHPKTKKYTCYNCEERVNSPQALLQHCVKHDMDVVQCGVCHHSEPSYKRMLRHLCECHPDSPLELSFRTGGQAAEFEKFVRKLRGSIEQNAGGVPESADSSSDVDGLLVSTLQSSYGRCEQEGAIVRMRRLSFKTCPFCSHRLVSLEDLTEHCVIAHQISLGISAILDLMLKAKNASAARDESLRCPFCDVAVGDKDALERHLFEEFEYAPMECEACGYATFSKEGLKEHFRATHPQKRPMFTVRRHDDFESWVASFIAAQEARRTVLEKPYQCPQCAERHRCTKELRMHLYAHLQYYPHHCTICEKCFTSQHDVEEHQRALHAVTDVYSVEEVRFENKEVKIDDFIDEATAKLRTVVESPTGRQCMWGGCPFSSPSSTELVTHMKAHIEQRKVCTTCQFSSYCNDILAWHSRQHSPVSSSTEVLPSSHVVAAAAASLVSRAKSRAYACCWCNFRAPSSMEIRVHCKVAHPGKAVKLVAPKRKDFHTPLPRMVSSTYAGSREDVMNPETREVNKTTDADGQHNVVTPPVRNSVALERQPLHSTARGISSQFANRRLSAQQFKCGQCHFLALSLQLLRLHEGIFHAGGTVSSTPGLNVASAVAKLLASLAGNATAVATERLAVVEEVAGPSSRLAPRSARGEDTCRKCSKPFPSKLLLYHHLVLVHHVYGVCDTCGVNLMNRTNALIHVGTKHLPEQATFTVLRSKELLTAAPPPAAAIPEDVRTPSVPSATMESGNICVIPLDGCDDPVPFSVFAQQHNVNPRVCLKDVAKLHSFM